MKNVTLERQSDGNYKLVEVEEQKAEMHQDSVESILAKLGFDKEKIASLTGTEKTVTMESPAFLDKLTNFDLMGIPVGVAAVGSALAIVVDRLVLAKVDPTNKWGSWANLAAAFAIKKYGGKLIGNKSADAAALILTYEAVADWVSMGLNKVWPTGATMNQAGMQQNYSSAVNQATRVAENYYASAFGG
jgi:hypothetical protein